MHLCQKQIKNIKTAADDLTFLQNTHQKYSEVLQQNKIDLEAMARSIVELNKRIKGMQIDLRNTLYEAVTAKHELAQSMLEGRGSMEELILDAIRKRYEKEWDLIQQDIDVKRNALNEEKTLINERLQARKKAAEKEDKYGRLTSLESQLSTISADPTRAKEQLALRKEIAQLRKELSWDIAEEEAQAQIESIDQQIKSLEDYVKWMDKYYEDLINNPTALAAEMSAVFQASNTEMIAWASANIKGFNEMTEAMQSDTINRMNQLAFQTDEEMIRWMGENVVDFSNLTIAEQETLIGAVRTMVTDSNDYVIDWLKKNNEEYQNATDTQEVDNGKWLD